MLNCTPQECICCGNNSGLLPVCHLCAEKFFPDFSTNESRCIICGKKLISENKICFECRENAVIQSLDSVIPLYSYSLWRKEILFSWKLSGQRNFALFFAQKVYSVYKKSFSGIPIVPVPPRPGKLYKKGWDQINDLAFFLEKIFGITVLKVLERTEVQQQKKLNRLQRLSHKGNSYILKNKIGILPKQVILLDDILTTGVTLESCASVLKKSGVEKVYGITIFIAE